MRRKTAFGGNYDFCSMITITYRKMLVNTCQRAFPHFYVDINFSLDMLVAL